MPKQRFHRAPAAQGRKALQLCRQVAEALHWILGSECGDEALQALRVVSVEPAPSAARLLVTVQAEADARAVLDRLAKAGGLLRSEVAASIHRRRAPELVFAVTPSI
jgi:ribosome-binding factor A